MQLYSGKELTVAKSVLALLEKYRKNGQTLEDDDIVCEARDPNGQLLVGSVDEIRFLERDGYLSISDEHLLPAGSSYFNVQITKSGRKWLELESRGIFTMEFLREQVLTTLERLDEAASWHQLTTTLQNCDENLSLVTSQQVLSSVRHLEKRRLVSWETHSGDGKILEFSVEITGKGLEHLEEEPSSQESSNVVNISGSSNVNVNLNSPDTRQLIQASKESKPKVDDAVALIRQILSRISELNLSVDAMRFERYLGAALESLEETPPDTSYAEASASKGLTLNEVREGIEIAEKTTGVLEKVWGWCLELRKICESGLGG